MTRLLKIILIVMLFSTNAYSEEIKSDSKLANSLTIKEEYADDPISQTWNFLINSAIAVSRSWDELPDGALPVFIPKGIVKAIASQKKSYE